MKTYACTSAHCLVMVYVDIEPVPACPLCHHIGSVMERISVDEWFRLIDCKREGFELKPEPLFDATEYEVAEP